jgi:hypothetical protein
MMKTIFVLSGLFILTALRPCGLRAEADERIGFELYSWQANGAWRYAVIEGTATAKPSSQIRATKTRLRNLTYVKGRLASLPAGESIYWRRDSARGFTMPDKETVQDLKRYAEGLQLHVIMPEDIQPKKSAKSKS